jgi:hypothetical protein
VTPLSFLPSGGEARSYGPGVLSSGLKITPATRTGRGDPSIAPGLLPGLALRG